MNMVVPLLKEEEELYLSHIYSEIPSLYLRFEPASFFLSSRPPLPPVIL